MTESKYGKYILKETGGMKPSSGTSAVIPASLKGLKDWGGVQHRIDWKYISQPVVLDKEPNSHDFDEFLCFIGCNPLNALNFGAEVELILGQEGEKHTINFASVTCIPKGLVHGPIEVKKLSQPILFCNIYLAPEYVRKPANPH